ncbi:uncharacterized protein LOC131571694 [Ammospiza caudacuta]|uniref:uncharacterized protein LOC131571694 n=1 Tax=Ammospiza caudacuta TaxID=2857398 RepID=UPI0027390B2B|nr:uncharacterized protein LOC131571694 [Ammospiza caudacuta]
MALPQLALTFFLTLVPLLLARGQTQRGPVTPWVRQEAGKCKIPSDWDPKLRFTPTRSDYALYEAVQLSCVGRFAPSVPLIQCISREAQIQWNETPTCKETCQRPAWWDPRLQLAPARDSYTENEEVTLSCNNGFQPSFTHVKCASGVQTLNYSASPKEDMWLGRNRSGVWIQVQGNIVCIEKCQKPQWDSRFIFDKEQEIFNPNEVVKIWCPEGYWPPPMEIKCVTLKPREGSMIPRSGWSMRSGTDAWHPLEGNLTCVDVRQVVPKIPEISSTSIKLNWTCRFPHMCQNIRARCQTEWHSSSDCETEEVKVEEMLQGQEGTFICSPLQPFTVYSVTISRLPSTILYADLHTTKEMVPDKPEKLWVDTSTGSLRWKAPPSCKGEIIGYQLNITTMRAEDGSIIDVCPVSVNQSVSEYVPPHQTAGNKYLVTVQGLTAAGAGPASQLEFQTYVLGQPMGSWPGSAVTAVVVVVLLLIPLSAGIIWFVLCRKKKALPSKVEEDQYTAETLLSSLFQQLLAGVSLRCQRGLRTAPPSHSLWELQPYENVQGDNYCVIETFPEKDAGKCGQAGEPFPPPLPVRESRQ